MHILQLAKKMPYPPHDGEAIAILQLTEGLQTAGHYVRLLTMNTSKHHYPLDQLPPTLQTLIDAVPIDTTIRTWAAFCNLFSSESYHIARFVSETYRQRLIRYLQQEQYDIIQLEGIYLTAYLPTIRQYSRAPVVLRAHNIEFEIWERLALQTRNPLKRYYLQLLARRLQVFELAHLSQVDAIVPISSKDAQFFQHYASCPMMTLVAGLPTDKYRPPTLPAVFPSLYFMGALDWLPNQEGLLWFLNEVWTAVAPQFPTLQLSVAGRSCPPALAQKLHQTPQVQYWGEIPEALPFIHAHQIMVIPLFSGSGMRLKIVEAMAARRCIIATSIAAEGIAYTHKKDILIADTADTFVKYLCQCLQDSNLCETIGSNAQQLAAMQHDNQQLIAQLVHFYEQLQLQ